MRSRALIFTMCCFVFFPAVESLLQRLCGNRLLDRVKIKTKFVHSSQFNSNATIPQLTLTAEFEVIGAELIELDGFLIHMRKSSDGESSESLLPVNVCNLRSKQFWVRSNNATCSVETDCATTGGRYCACQPNCSLIPKRFCKGTEDWVVDHNMISVQPNIRILTFNTDFDQSYVFTVYPYAGISVGTKPKKFNSRKSPGCVEILIRKGMHAANAAEICCRANVTDYTVRDVTFHRPVIDVDKQSVSVPIQWLPPITQENIIKYDVRISLSRRYFVKNDSTNVTKRILGAKECFDASRTYSANLTSLAPSTDYQVRISVYHSGKSTSCVSGICWKLFSFRTPDVNICDRSLHFCDQRARCLANKESAWNATCVCSVGYHGNGIDRRRRFGSGCVDEDYCSPHLNPCDEHARCTDKPAPARGATCVCPNMFYGDGLKLGSKCESRLGKIVAICLTLAVVLLLISFVISRRIWIRRRLEHDIKWSEFVANQSLHHKTALLDNRDKGEVCMPTFGEQPELDRNDIILCDVIGRGNCGVVYNAFYKTCKGVNDEKEMVAVKTSQDKASHHVIDFLSEIGLMLNIGDHPNVIRVIGCCTTQKPILLVTEFLLYGDLLHFLWDAREPEKCAKDPAYQLTERSLYYMSQQVASGMEYLTKSKIIHGDLAARNILVGENLACKISDFGLANDVYRYGVIKGQQERCVPYKWISPERMMSGKEPITSKSDVWSFGNLMYEMVTLGCAPHAGVSPDELLDKLKSGYRMKQPSTCTSAMYSIMTKCWKWHPYSRPSFTELVRLTGGAINRVHTHEKNNII